MKRGIIKSAAILLLVFSIFSLTSFACHANNEEIKAFSYIDGGERVNLSSKKDKNEVNVSSRIYELLFGGKDNKNEEIYLIPSGEIFGLRIKEEYLTVSAASEGSALRKGDKIIAVSEKEIHSADDVTEALSETKGNPVRINIIRGGEKMTITATPKLEDGIYKLGINLRAFASGIGTVTFIDPKTGAFGGLGHAVSEPESGKIVEMGEGEVCSALLGGIKKGEVGKPGELAGVLGRRRLGSIEENNECGVFGILEECRADKAEAIPVGLKDEIKEGEAEIISTVKNGKTLRYKIEITDIDKASSGSKSFKIKVTDPTLLNLTGGIVRGMSGSPIIQNGKLVGAVTHVLVANPAEGYGIFIENMLNSTQSHSKAA